MNDFGYCCNVHGGTSLDEVKANLDRHTTRVKELFSPEANMRIGLWLSRSALAGLGESSQAKKDATDQFGDWLAERGLIPFTFNGFPFGDFHQEVVKHDVYLPSWDQQARYDYTLELAQVQRRLLARNTTWTENLQTISTLPLGWPSRFGDDVFSTDADFLKRCSEQLRTLATALHQLEDSSGKQTIICIEPEPGCVLDTATDITRFFDEFLFTENSVQNDLVRRHIGVCHDVCHSAVKFEDQSTAVKAYKAAGISIGKVQVSSAVESDFDDKPESNEKRLQQLQQFSEPKYLHQTSVLQNNSQTARFFEDLPDALAEFPQPCGKWRVHFHVPIFAEELGSLSTTQSQIGSFLKSLDEEQVQVPHFEVETYAWNVLPDSHRSLAGNLAEGIAEELRWFAAAKSSD
jgi:hypothetical protein